MTKKRFCNNIILHRMALIVFVPLFFILLLIESIFYGIKVFFEHQVYAWCGLFYEPYKEFTYFFRKYTKKNTWNW